MSNVHNSDSLSDLTQFQRGIPYIRLSVLHSTIQPSPASCDPRLYASAGSGKGKRGSSNSHLDCVTIDQSDSSDPNSGQ